MTSKIHHYSNPDITISWTPERCIHSRICWHNLREVFDPAKRPWIMPEGASTEKIMEQIDKCPSQALSYQKKETTAPVEAAVSQPGVVKVIECLPNGPLLVNGDVMVKKTDGTEELKTGTVALCRCGASANKPYCDGAHNRVGFQG